METENKLLQELNELRLLVQGLSRVTGFPVELLELMRIHLNQMEHLIQRTPLLQTENNQEKAEGVSQTTGQESLVGHPKPVPDRMIKAEEMKRSLTLNDRFRFQRELFDNDAVRMSDAIMGLSELSGRQEALAYIKAVCPDCEKADCFPDFNAMLDNWFPVNLEAGFETKVWEN